MRNDTWLQARQQVTAVLDGTDATNEQIAELSFSLASLAEGRRRDREKCNRSQRRLVFGIVAWVLLLASLWWFTGRNPRVEVVEPGSPELVLVVPKPLGWESWQLRFWDVPPNGSDSAGWYYLSARGEWSLLSAGADGDARVSYEFP